MKFTKQPGPEASKIPVYSENLSRVVVPMQGAILLPNGTCDNAWRHILVATVLSWGIATGT